MCSVGHSRFPRLEKLAVGVFVLSFLLLTIVGVLTTWVLGIPLEGYWLLTHVSFGGIFTVALAALVILWAHACRLDGQDTGKKACFWLMTVAGLGLILSAVLSMFPLLGTEGQEWMVSAHGVCAYLAMAAFLGYAILLLYDGRKPRAEEELQR